MQVAHQSAIGDEKGEGLDRDGSLVGGRDVVEHLQQAGDEQDQRQEYRQTPGCQGVTQACLSGRDGGRVEMVKKIRAHTEIIPGMLKTAPFPGAVYS